MIRSSVAKCLLALLMVIAGGAHAAGLRVGDTVPFPEIRTVDGGRIDAAVLRGKVVVLSYFATTCPFCANEAPKLQKLYRENRDRLVVIGVNIQRNDPEQHAKTRQWIAKYGITHPVTTDFTALENAFGKLKGLPVNQVFDRSGKAVRIDVGEIFDEDFDDIARLAK